MNRVRGLVWAAVLVLGDAGAGVLHQDALGALRSLDLDLDAARLRELDGVADQVRDDQPDELRVAVHRR